MTKGRRCHKLDDQQQCTSSLTFIRYNIYMWRIDSHVYNAKYPEYSELLDANQSNYYRTLLASTGSLKYFDMRCVRVCVFGDATQLHVSPSAEDMWKLSATKVILGMMMSVSRYKNQLCFFDQRSWLRCRRNYYLWCTSKFSCRQKPNHLVRTNATQNHPHLRYHKTAMIPRIIISAVMLSHSTDIIPQVAKSWLILYGCLAPNFEPESLVVTMSWQQSRRLLLRLTVYPCSAKSPTQLTAFVCFEERVHALQTLVGTTVDMFATMVWSVVYHRISKFKQRGGGIFV